MVSFIHDVLVDQQHKSRDLSKLTFILPSKRAGVFLKHELSQLTSDTFFTPEIFSIEEFVETLSQLKQIPNTELLFEFYSVYLKTIPKDKAEPFDSFSKWAQILIQDFNEIDRYLIDTDSIFDYLSAVKELNHWSVDHNKTKMVQNYLAFWNSLKGLYTELSNVLIQKGIGYQGLMYREAVEQLEDYIQINQHKQHVFIGFNALNSAESMIIQELLQSTNAEIYWDTDNAFLNNKHHDASYFIRQHKTNWKYFKTNPFNWTKNYYKKNKNITVIGTPKHIGQAKYIGELLSDLQTKNGSLKNTAVILGDENLLIPVINSIPKSVETLNITMGFPLKLIPLASLFDQLLLLHKDSKTAFYYKDVISILSNEFIAPILKSDKGKSITKIIESIQINNLVFLTKDKIQSLFDVDNPLIELVFTTWKKDASLAITNCQKLILNLKNNLDQKKESNLLALEYLYRFNEVFNSLKQINDTYRYINSIAILHGLYKELISTETLDFQGEPLQGLQIMGMLESRVLDFETVIISSVNEGILPSGKSNNSFIPFDIKIEQNLPTYKEKDAVYTYHFYRLIQRAKNVYIIYNTEPDVLKGGEKSRFITQMEIENIHNLKHIIVTPKVPSITSNINRIYKTDAVINKIKELAAKGFSPSSLTNYIRNPLDFYYQKILGIKENDLVEETVAANTLGTVVHETLKDLYSPLLHKNLNVSDIKDMKPKIEALVKKHFQLTYKKSDLKKGKNLIIFEIAKRYVLNFLNTEIDDLKNGNSIKVLHVETDVEASMYIDEIDFSVVIKGQIDRIDEYNGTLRVIDYKTGNVQSNKVELVDWNDIITDYDKYSKSFQVLMYAYILNANKPFTQPVEAGVVSFKNLNAGFLKFGKKEKPNSRQKNNNITQDTLNAFSEQLKKLILEIFNPDIDFIEKEI